jgi:hypothetical protein
MEIVRIGGVLLSYSALGSSLSGVVSEVATTHVIITDSPFELIDAIFIERDLNEIC